MPIKRYSILLVLILISFFEVSSQGKVKQFLSDRKEKKKLAFEEGSPWLSPLIAPAYTADAGFLISGGMLYSFKVNRNDTISQRSSLPATIFYSSKGNFGIRTFLKTFWFEDKYRFNANLTIRDKDNHYYGKGYERIEATYKSDTTTLYHETTSMADIDLIYKIRPFVFAGLKFKPGYASTKDFSEPVENDPYRSQFGDKYFLNGIGAQFAYDTRDIVVNAWSGVLLNVSALFYDNITGSNYDFQEYSFDARYYKTLTRPGNVLAFRFYTRATYGDVPITELSDFSGGKNLRGYRMGHYRDNTTSFLLGEWRYTFQKRDNSLSKSGMVLWLGTGSIAPDVVNLTKWLPNGGIGYRLELQPRMNVCIDLGFGKETQGIYFNFTEAF
jgi:hypothetical protein